MKFLALLVLALVAFFVSAADLSPTAAYGLEESAVIETVDVSGDGGLLKLVLKKGNGALATKGSQISAHYDGKLTSGKQFDSSYKRNQPFSFRLGGGQVSFSIAWVGSMLLQIPPSGKGQGVPLTACLMRACGVQAPALNLR